MKFFCDKKEKNKKEEKEVHLSYGDILTVNEIYNYGMIVYRFEKEK